MTTLQPDAAAILERIEAVAAEFARDRHARQRRRELDPADFDRLRAAGFHLASLPTEHGGLWQDRARSLRAVCELLRALAHGDASVALVASMHPAVLMTGGWLVMPRALPPYEEAWAAQRQWVFETVRAGAWWGTIMSEPGSGGDLSRTKAVARLVPGDPPGVYRLSGQKHFGSGSGVTSYMITSAVPEGEAEFDIFVLSMRGVPWDGSAGVRLTGPWDGHGMIATQSHGFAFEDFPATRLAWPSHSRKLAPSGHMPGGLFASVIVGIVEVALETARAQLARRPDPLRPYEQVEWTRADLEGWLVRQAYEGVLRSVERGDDAPRTEVLGKVAIAELAESALGRLCRILGGGTYARHSPFGFWFEDVRALGFLRPLWGQAYDTLFQSAWPAP